MRHDVIVVGGGVCGIVTALHCRDAGFRVALVEKKLRLGCAADSLLELNNAGRTNKRTTSMLKRYMQEKTKPYTMRDLVRQIIATLQEDPNVSIMNGVSLVNLQNQTKAETGTLIANCCDRNKNNFVLHSTCIVICSSNLPKLCFTKHTNSLPDTELRQTLLCSSHISFPYVPKSNAARQSINLAHHPHAPLFVVGHDCVANGDMFEDMLASVEDVVPRLLQHVRIHHMKQEKRGGGLSLRTWVKERKGTLTWADLDTLKTRFPDTKWVMLRDPASHKLLVLDVTKWMFQHPGGSYPFETKIHQNITDDFNSIVSHKMPDGSWNPRVLKMINKHTLAVLR